MNERIFKKNVLLVIGVYFVAIIIGILLKAYDPSKDAPVYGTFKDLVPLIIAIPAAWLGYCFQRRQAYLKDIRDLWSKMILAFQDTIQYTHLSEPPQAEYGKVLKALSIATEELRAVFVNIGEDGANVGLFPFESIKSIHDKISLLGFGTKFDTEQAKITRREIIELWKKLRKHFLSELERGLPANADSPYLK
jgi:hypothetical protein